MNGRILFTGTGTRILEDMMAHALPGYQKKSCAPAEHQFCSAIDEFKPDVVVTCVHHCRTGHLNMYEALEDKEFYRGIPLIVIGNEEDCTIFRRHIFHRKMKIMVRPVSYEMLQEAVEEYLKEAARQEEKRKQEESEKEQEGVCQTDGEDDEKKPLGGPSPDSKRSSILVVDDDARMLNVIKMYLQDLYDVTVVPSGKLALKFLSKKHADLVLLDYLMPDMDGLEVLYRIQKESPCPDIPVIFLTGVAEKDKVLKGLAFNPRGYLLKPVARDVLLERVTEVLLGLS